MAATWSIVTLDRVMSLNDKSDVVVRIHWNLADSETVGSGKDEVIHSGRAFGEVTLDTSELSTFTEYKDISESPAIEWVKNALGDDEVARHEKRVADQIQESKTPTKGTGVPW